MYFEQKLQGPWIGPYKIKKGSMVLSGLTSGKKPKEEKLKVKRVPKMKIGLKIGNSITIYGTKISSGSILT